MNDCLQNKLAEKPTPWKWWYAFFPLLGFVVPSILLGLVTPENNPSIIASISPLILFVVLGILSIGLVWLFSRKKPTSSDLGFDTKTLTKRNVIIVLTVFVVTHVLFQIFAAVGGLTSDVKADFLNAGFGKGFTSDLIVIISSVYLAPIFEELAYRGVMLRSMHDGLLKFFPNQTSLIGIPALAGITYTAIMFIMPHVSDMSINPITLSYFVTSAGFSIVYLLTRSMVTAMVSHSLQSWFAFSQLLFFGHGDIAVSPIIYAIAFTCPLVVYLIGRGMQKLATKGQDPS